MIPDELVKDAQRMLDIVEDQNFIRVLGHYDADGVSSAAVVSLALQRLNISFQTRILPSLSQKGVETHVKGADSCVILTDLGSSLLRELDQITSHPIIVIDHHAMPPGVKTEHIVNLNAYNYGLDGATEVSSSTLAATISIIWDEKNWSLIKPGLIGAIGDKETVIAPSGLNKYLIEEAKKQKIFEERVELALDPAPLVDSLAYAIDPHFPGIRGIEGASRFLKNAGINPGATFSDLDRSEQRKLASLLILDMFAAGAEPEAIRTSVRRRYFYPRENMYADYLARVVDSCGRSGVPEVGLGLLCGSLSLRTDAESVTMEFKRKVNKGIEYLKSGGITAMRSLYYFQWDDPAVSGILAEVATLYLGRHDKPVFGISPSGTSLKISSRTTRSMVAKNVNLGEVCRGAAERCGGRGGGHNIAAGATIPASAMEVFLSHAERILEEQVSRQKP